MGNGGDDVRSQHPTVAHITGRSTAIGHRIVHGGPSYTEPLVISGQVRDALQQLVPFAPNHLPQEIAVIDGLSQREPGVPQVACFDTAFHQRMPDVARRLPIPASYDRRGVRRYGFHGSSYTFLIEELSRAAGPDAARGRVILTHLGVDPAANDAHADLVSRPTSRVTVRVMPTDEELMIARATYRVVAPTTGMPTRPELLGRIDLYGRAANYLAVGQIDLVDNPLLREPLQPAHITPRVSGAPL